VGRRAVVRWQPVIAIVAITIAVVAIASVGMASV
jgi:hypothetical protein